VRTRRDGFALAAVLAVMVLIIPVVFVLALRSRAAMDWHVKLEDQKKALLLAEEGEARASDALRGGSSITAGDRRLPMGGMEFRIVAQPPGDSGQKIVAVVGEGIHLGEERLLLGFVEVFGTGPGSLLIESDRAWIYPGGGSGSLVNLSALIAEHRRRVDRYLNALLMESQSTPDQFANRIRDQSQRLTCPDIQRDWSAIRDGLLRAKCSGP
jgi:hypothetical protein